MSGALARARRLPRHARPHADRRRRLHLLREGPGHEPLLLALPVRGDGHLGQVEGRRCCSHAAGARARGARRGPRAGDARSRRGDGPGDRGRIIPGRSMRLPIPLPLGGGPDAISPTAHYTGHVWVRNGLSHPELATVEGRAFYAALTPLMMFSRASGGPTLEGGLVARHRVIDELLARAIDDGSVGQVVEVAAGMSPRGWRFSRRYEDAITYVEADLQGMAERKRR